LASGFVDGAKESYQHLRDLYRTIKKHGPGVVLPSREAVEEWVKEVEEQCLDRLDDCAKDKAREASEALNRFRQKPWEDKKYTMGQWSWSAVRRRDARSRSLLGKTYREVDRRQGRLEKTIRWQERASSKARAGPPLSERCIKQSSSESSDAGTVHQAKLERVDR
jgi:hypothetical protein